MKALIRWWVTLSTAKSCLLTNEIFQSNYKEFHQANTSTVFLLSIFTVHGLLNILLQTMCHDKFFLRGCFETAKVKGKHKALDYCTYFGNDVSLYHYSIAFSLSFVSIRTEKCSKMKLLVRYINSTLNYPKLFTRSINKYGQNWTGQLNLFQ